MLLLTAALALGCCMTARVSATIEPWSAMVKGPGATAELRCLSPLDDPELTWWRRGGEGEWEELKEVKDKYVINQENSSLVIKRVAEADVGIYKCSDSDSEAVVILYAAPYVRSEKSSRSYNQGNTLELVCNAWGYPYPSASWYVDETPVVPDGKRVKVENSTLLHNGKLTIENLNFTDYRVYTCIATNEHGNHTGTTLVRVKSKLAWLWPIVGMVIQFALLAIIIFFYEQHKKKAMAVEKRRVEEFNKNLAAASQPKQSEESRKNN